MTALLTSSTFTSLDPEIPFPALGKQLFLLPGPAPFPYSLAPVPEPNHMQWATHPAGEEGLGETVPKRFKILLMNTI